MTPSDNPPSDFVPLSPESLELYQQFWAQMGTPTTTQPPMDFLALKQGALQWGERLNLPAGILVKFRQRIAAAQSDREVFDAMEKFLRLATVPPDGIARGAAASPAPDRETRTTPSLPHPPAASPLTAALTTGGPAPAPGGEAAMKRKGRRSMTLDMSRRAILMVDHGLSNRVIATQLGVSLTSVKRNPAVLRARAELKARRAQMPRGHKSKTGDIEAYDDGNEDDEPKPFRPR